MGHFEVILGDFEWISVISRASETVSSSRKHMLMPFQRSWQHIRLI